ncbi:MAG: PUA-like domain, partial [Clostridia bacterium]|nr:PUA-like domain [Clostridia bacterium]
MIKVTLKKGEEIRIQQGHPWIFNNEVKSIEGS